MLRLMPHLACCAIALVLASSQVACGSKKNGKKEAAPAPEVKPPVTVTPPISQNPSPSIDPMTLLIGNYVLERNDKVQLAIAQNLGVTTSVQMPVTKKGGKKPTLASLQFSGPLTADPGSRVFSGKGHLVLGEKIQRPVTVKVLAPVQGASQYVDVTLSAVVFDGEVIDYPYTQATLPSGGVQQNAWSGCDDDCDDDYDRDDDDCDDDHDHDDDCDDDHDHDDDCDDDHDHDDDCDDDHDHDHDHDDDCDDDDDCRYPCSGQGYQYKDFVLRFLKI